MEQNLKFCIKLFIYSFHNEGQREILQMIDADLNPFMMELLRSVGVITHTGHRQTSN